jgi:hypothetical protein
MRECVRVRACVQLVGLDEERRVGGERLQVDSAFGQVRHSSPVLLREYGATTRAHDVSDTARHDATR